MAVLPMPCTTPRNTMQGWGAHPHTCPEDPHSPGPLTPTSPIAVAEVWEAPDVAKAHGIAHAGQHKLDLVAPVATLDALLLLALLPGHGAVLQRDAVGCVNWGPPCWPRWKGDSRQVGLGGPRHPSPSRPPACPCRPPHTDSAKEGEGTVSAPPSQWLCPEPGCSKGRACNSYKAGPGARAQRGLCSHAPPTLRPAREVLLGGRCPRLGGETVGPLG